MEHAVHTVKLLCHNFNHRFVQVTIRHLEDVFHSLNSLNVVFQLCREGLQDVLVEFLNQPLLPSLQLKGLDKAESGHRVCVAKLLAILSDN